jgi:hypothetical protein
MRLMPHPDTTDAAIQPQASQRGLPGMGASAREGRAGDCLGSGEGTVLSPVSRMGIRTQDEERVMSFGKGALLWLIGVPIPIILLIAVFMHH